MPEDAVNCPEWAERASDRLLQHFGTPLQGNAWVIAVPRAALHDVPSLRSALGYDVAAPFGAKAGRSPYMRVRTGRFNEAEQVRPRVSLNSIPLGLATRHSSCRLHWLSFWPYATDLCDFSRAGRLGVAGRPTQLALGDVCLAVRQNY